MRSAGDGAAGPLPLGGGAARAAAAAGRHSDA